MSLKILNAHTGASYRTEAVAHSSLERLQSWIAQAAGVQPSLQILMTAQGKPIKLQSLADSEIFLFDKSILVSSSSASKLLPLHFEVEHGIALPPPPHTVYRRDSQRDLQVTTQARQKWANAYADTFQGLLRQLQRYEEETQVVRRGTTLAVDNVRRHLVSLRDRFGELQEWAKQVSHDQNQLLSSWQTVYKQARGLHVDEQFVSILEGGAEALQRASNNVELANFVDEDLLKEADISGGRLTRQLADRTVELGSLYDDIVADAQLLVDGFQAVTQDVVSKSQATLLLEEIDALTNKIGTDLDRLGEYDRVSQALKLVHRHELDIVPSIEQAGQELVDCLTQALQGKYAAIKTSTDFLQRISHIESQISKIHAKFAAFDVDAGTAETFDLLHFAIKLPSAYGLSLVEYVRRCEQNESEVEAKRRAAWYKSMEGLLRIADDATLTIQDFAGRKSLNDYTQQLKSAGLKHVLEEINDAAAELDSKNKRPRAFKHGSLHEAAQGFSAAPSSERTKPEEKLRSAESRIRKLEDLLHRQSQMQRRPSSGGFSPAPNVFDRVVATPTPPPALASLSKARDDISRRSSFSSRRVSQNFDGEEKDVARRIVRLEAELMTTRAENKTLKRDAAGRAHVEDNLKSQAREAIATKEDLLSNMEAQQHEFDNERRLLEAENHKLNIKLEELEDEFDRVINSEHDNKIHALQDEIERYREQADRVDEARERDNLLHHEKITVLEETARNRETRHVELESAVRDLQQKVAESAAKSRKVHSGLSEVVMMLSPHAESKEEVIDLLHHLRGAIETAQAKRRDLETEQDNLHRQLETTRAEAAEQQTRAKGLFEEKDRLASELQALQTSHQESSLTKTAVERQLSDLRSKFVSLQGFHGELDDRLTETNDAHDKLRQLHKEQADRATEVSRRLYLHTESMKKLLAVLGYTVTQDDTATTVRRIPKPTPASATNSITLADAHMSSSLVVRQSFSGTLPTMEELAAGLASSPVVQWPLASDSTTYNSAMTLLSLDAAAVAETILKRVKDTEHIARKWQREAKSYRDKARRAQAEAHDKVALRGFQAGDLALFLPTRDQATKPWAAFNVGAPHYFLRERNEHRLGKRDWLIARISRVEERVVDLSKIAEEGKGEPDEEENPYRLSDGLRWYLLDAVEEKPSQSASSALPAALAPAEVQQDSPATDIASPQETVTPAQPADTTTSTSAKTLLPSASNSTSARPVTPIRSAGAALSSVPRRSSSSASYYSPGHPGAISPAGMGKSRPTVAMTHDEGPSARSISMMTVAAGGVKRASVDQALSKSLDEDGRLNSGNTGGGGGAAAATATAAAATPGSSGAGAGGRLWGRGFMSRRQSQAGTPSPREQPPAAPKVKLPATSTSGAPAQKWDSLLSYNFHMASNNGNNDTGDGQGNRVDGVM